MEKNPKKVIKTTTTTTVTTTEEVVDHKLVETHYLLILDESGSMDGLRSVTINNVNEQIQMIKDLDKKYPDQKYFISLVTFNTEIKERFMDVPAAEMKEITKKDYTPNGGTALRDAMGIGITKLEDNLRPRMNDKEKIATAVIVVITDGEENSSSQWDITKTKNLIERLNKDDKWTISYIGANQDAILVGSNYGFSMGNTVNYAATASGTRGVTTSLFNTMSVRADNISANAYSYQGGDLSNDEFLSAENGNIKEAKDDAEDNKDNA